MPEVTYYVTKYALTKGILKVHGEVDEGYLYATIPGSFIGSALNNRQLFKPADWYHDEEQALDRAESILEKKIESLQKQIKKLDSLDKFKINDLTK